MKLFLLFCLSLFPVAAGAATIPAGQLLEPSVLAKELKTKEAPLVLHVGFEFLYKGGHIPGSKYVGAAKDEAGLKKLREFVKSLPHDREIVLYCGCCPFEKCPNVEPALHAMQEMGFTKVKVLDLRKNFADDWDKKGFPVER